MSDLILSKGDEAFLTTFEALKEFILDNHPSPNIDFLALTMRLYEIYPQAVNLGDYFNNSFFSDIDVCLIYRLEDIGILWLKSKKNFKI